MPVQKRWTAYNRANIEKVPEGVCRVYEIANKNKHTIYIGGSSSPNIGVRGRLLSHLDNRKFPSGKFFRYAAEGFMDDGIEMEAAHVHRHTQTHGKKPTKSKRSPRRRNIFGFPLD